MKIYSLISVIALSSVFYSCESEIDDKIVNLENPASVSVSVTGIDPEYGWRGDQFNVVGENFGGATSFFKVYIGKNETEVLSCSDKQVKVVVPEDATSGKVYVEFMGDTISSSFFYKVMGQPSVEAMFPLFGEDEDTKCWTMPGNEITLMGEMLGGTKDDVSLRFNKSATDAEITSWSENEIKVKVPADAQSGAITLKIGSQEVNVPYELLLVNPLTIESVTPEEGYAGCEVQIIGKGFGDASTLEGTKVWFGEKAGTVKDVKDETITVLAPQNLSEGEYAIKVLTPFEEKTSELKYTVNPDPTELTAKGGEEGSGYLGNIITVTGNNLPESVEDIIVNVGGIDTEVIEKTENGFKVRIPAEATTGKGNLLFKYAGRKFTIDTGFEVKAAPIVNKYDVITVSGETFTIGGTNLDELKENLIIKFNGTAIGSPNINESEITFTVPTTDEYQESVEVELSYGENLIEPIKFNVAVIPATSGNNDITSCVLKNAGPTFENEGGNARYWEKNSKFYGNSLITVENGSTYLSMIGNGSNNYDGALYQNTMLPKGDYTVTITVAGDDNAVVDAGGRDGVVFGIMDGHDIEFPALTDQGSPWYFSDKTNVLAEMNITEGNNSVPNEHAVTFSLIEAKEVKIGFATMLNPNNYLYISQIKIERTN